MVYTYKEQKLLLEMFDNNEKITASEQKTFVSKFSFYRAVNRLIKIGIVGKKDDTYFMHFKIGGLAKFIFLSENYNNGHIKLHDKGPKNTGKGQFLF